MCAVEDVVDHGDLLGLRNKNRAITETIIGLRYQKQQNEISINYKLQW